MPLSSGEVPPMWIDDLSSFGPCPVCPETENKNWTAEHADIAGLSSLSSLSRTKTALAPLPMDGTPDTWEGRPCCYLPRTPEQLGLAGYIGPDLRGLGIPAEGLPGYLRPFSVNGWRVRIVNGQATMERAHPDARREDGCRDYLKAHAIQIATEARLFEARGATCVS